MFCKGIWQYILKIKKTHTFDLAIPFMGIYLIEIKSQKHDDLCTMVLLVDYFFFFLVANAKEGHIASDGAIFEIQKSYTSSSV